MHFTGSLPSVEERVKLEGDVYIGMFHSERSLQAGL